MNKLNYFITILFITLLTSCGYKVLTLNQLGDYKITEINLSNNEQFKSCQSKNDGCRRPCE